MRKILNIIFIVCVAIVIAIPAITISTNPDKISVVENRKLATPAPIKDGVTNYMTTVNKSINDRIGFRDEAMTFYNKQIYGLLKANHSKVLVGKDGWLFYRDDIPDYNGSNIDTAKTERQVQILKYIDNWCKERNIKFVLALGPNKTTVYDNYLNYELNKAKKSNLDIIVPKLKAENINVIYPKDELIRDRDSKDLYMKLDTHWNSYGSKYLLDGIVDSLGLPNKDFKVTENRLNTGDLLTMLGTGKNGYNSLHVNVETNPNATIKSTTGSLNQYIECNTTDKFVCYRDSYTIAMMPYYTYYFNGPVYWTYNINFSEVEKQAPKYLILSCVERYFDAAMDANSGLLK